MSIKLLVSLINLASLAIFLLSLIAAGILYKKENLRKTALKFTSASTVFLVISGIILRFIE